MSHGTDQRIKIAPLATDGRSRTWMFWTTAAFLSVIVNPFLVTPLRMSWGDAFSVLWTLLFPCFALLSWMSRPRFPSWLKAFALLYGLFLVWAFSTLARAPVREFSVQNLAVFSAFLFGTLCFSSRSRQLWRTIGKAVCLSSLLSAGVFFWTLMTTATPDQEKSIYRPLALLITVLLVWTTANARFSERLHRRLGYLFLSALNLITIFATGSRATLAIGLALALMAVSFGSDGRLRLGRLALGVAAAFAGLAGLLMYVPDFSQRPGRDVIEVGEADINVSGRLTRWEATVESWSATGQSRIFGRGAGAVAEPMARWPGPHPLNDYLRLLHDYGIVGLTLWIGAMLSLGIPALLQSLRNPQLDSPLDARARLVIINSLLLLAAGCFVLNPLIYIFVLAPLSIMIGVASTPMPRQNSYS